MFSHWGQDPLHGNPRYSSIRTLNHDGRTLLQLALDRNTGEKVAIKFTQRGWEEGRNKYMLRELLIHQELSACHHPHIVELRDVFLTPHHLAAVMEYVEGEDLQTFLSNTGGRVSEALGRFLFQQLVLALDFCHARGKVSRGVKLANTLLSLSPGQLPLVKLADFGFSKDTGRHSAPASQVGTALFVPPEVMHNFSHTPYDGTLVDVWACGIVLFMLLFGRHPCLRPEDNGLNEQQQMLALFTRTAASQFCLMPEEAAAISPGCADLLGHMLKTDPTQRYSMCQVQVHPWFTTGLPEGAALMNTTILAEAAARPLQLRHTPEAMAAFVRQGQKIEPHPLTSHFPSGSPAAAAVAAAVAAAPAAAVNIPRSPGSSGGTPAAAAARGSAGAVVGSSSMVGRVASSGGAAAAGACGSMVGSMDDDTHNTWGAPPPARLLIHSCSSNDKQTGLHYKKQEQQMLDSGLMPPARFHMSESMSSSHGSFVAQHHQQRTAAQQQQQQQQAEFASLLESIPSAGLEEELAQSPQQQQQQQRPQQAVHYNQQQQQQQQQFQMWAPQQRGNPVSSTTTSAGEGGITAASPTSPCSALHAELHSAPGGSSGTTHSGTNSHGQQQQQQQQRPAASASEVVGPLLGNMQALGIQQQVQQQQAQLQLLRQQHQQASAAAAAAVGSTNASTAAMNGAQQMSLLNSADLAALLPLDDNFTPKGRQQQQQFSPPAAHSTGSTAAAAAAGGGGAVGTAGHELMEKQSSFLLMLEGISSLPVLPDNSVDELLNPAANPLLDTPLPNQYHQQQLQLQQSNPQQQQQQQQQQRPAASAPAGPYQQQQQQGMGDVEVPDDYAAFMVDDEDLAAVASEGAAGRRKRVLSQAGAGVSSCDLDLRKLSDLLMGGSSMQLMEGSMWHKICKTVSFTRGGRSGPAAFGGDTVRAGDIADDAATGGAAVDDDDDIHALLGLREMSITH